MGSNFKFLNENDPFEKDVELIAEIQDNYSFRNESVVHFEQYSSIDTPFFRNGGANLANGTENSNMIHLLLNFSQELLAMLAINLNKS